MNMGVYGRLERIKELAECVIANVEAEKARIAMEPPRGVVVQCGGRDIRLATIDEIGAGVCPGAGPRLYVKLGSCLSWTTTPLADIIAQAAAAGMELPPVTVQAGYDWSHIAEVQRHADGTTIFGQVDGEGIHNETSLTPAEVCQLCKLAGWPWPDVRCEFHYCDGTPCEIDPADVRTATLFRRDTAMRKHTQIELFAQVDGSRWREVREPVPVVQRMIDACREGE